MASRHKGLLLKIQFKHRRRVFLFVSRRIAGTDEDTMKEKVPTDFLPNFHILATSSNQQNPNCSLNLFETMSSKMSVSFLLNGSSSITLQQGAKRALSTPGSSIRKEPEPIQAGSTPEKPHGCF